MQNIDRFNLYTAHILAKLYAEFPVAKEIKPEDVVTALREVIPSEGDQAKLNSFVGYTIMWLIETNYLISFGELPRRLVLAPKAFEAMNAPLPEALRRKSDEKKSIGQKLTDVSEEFGHEVRSEGIKQLASQLVGQVIGHAMRAYSGT